MLTRRQARTTVLLMGVMAGFILALGCSQPQPMTSVTGKVLYNSEPLKFGVVMFHPSKGQVAQAEIRPDGTFELSTFRKEDGVVPGHYKASVLCYEAHDPQNAEILDDEGGRNVLGQIFDSLEIYSGPVRAVWQRTSNWKTLQRLYSNCKDQVCNAKTIIPFLVYSLVEVRVIEMKYWLVKCVFVWVAHATCTWGQSQAPAYDVVVYGGTSAGVIAAVQAARMGKSVVLVSPDKHLGGLSSGGLGFSDTGRTAVIGGLSREFYHRIWKHYQDDSAWKWQARAEFGNQGQGSPAMDGKARTMWVFEPHVAERVFEDLIAEHHVTVQRDEWLDRANGKGVTHAR